MITVIINNWKELVDFMGLDIAKKVCLSLKQEALKDYREDNGHLIEWSEKHESCCIFKFMGKEKQRNITTVFYEYQGTVS